MKKIAIFIVIIVLIVAAISVFIVLNHAPGPLTEVQKNAALAKILGRKPNLTDNTPTGNTEYKGKYVKFSYPAMARIYDSHLAKDSIYLDFFSFDIMDPRLIFNLAVKTNGQGVSTFSDIPDIKLRQFPGSGYTETDIKADGEKGIAFTRGGDNPEESAFFIISSKTYSFLVTGNYPEDTDKLFNDLIKTVKFVR